jgi:hypothetical protein
MTNPINLYLARKKSEYIITEIPEIPLLNSLGIRSGTRIKLLNRYVLGGPVLLRVEGAYTVALGKDIAGLITVSQVSYNERAATEVFAV